jgi:hypothetical protein
MQPTKQIKSYIIYVNKKIDDYMQNAKHIDKA